MKSSRIRYTIIMRKLPIVLLTLVAGWVILSIIMMWPPVCRYMGESGYACIGVLRQIHGAKEQYALEVGRTNGPIDPAAVAAYMRPGLRCTSGGTYRFGEIGEDPTCSLANGPVPPAQKERVLLIGWRWKVWPSSHSSHRLD